MVLTKGNESKVKTLFQDSFPSSLLVCPLFPVVFIKKNVLNYRLRHHLGRKAEKNEEEKQFLL